MFILLGAFMKIKSIYLEGFRNFKKATIAFAEKSVVIGSNDIGKTNLLFALRLRLTPLRRRNPTSSHDCKSCTGLAARRGVPAFAG